MTACLLAMTLAASIPKLAVLQVASLLSTRAAKATLSCRAAGIAPFART